MSMRRCRLVSRFVVGMTSVTVLVVLAAGCGSSSGPAMHPVSGAVTIGGKAAKDMRIDFYPVDASSEMASGNVDSSGNYSLLTGQMGKPGAAAGKYKVVLTPTMTDMTDSSYMKAPQSSGPPKAPSGVVPKEYTSVGTTPKEVEVKAGSNTIDIQI